MKKLLGLLFALAVMATATTALGVDNVAGTKHNLSSTGTGSITTSDTTEICVFCHTPHIASGTAKPLWNRSTDATGYTMYNSVWSSTIDETVDAAPGGVSLACLSCHDGTTAFDSLLNYPGSGTAGSFTFTPTTMTGIAALGKDLTNDHPISIMYRVSDTAFNTENADGTVGTNNLPLYSGKVECGSCHNPHEATLQTFLRMSNAGSNLCTTCHIK